ncbi:MAG: CAP domain-containing protein [Chloroflexota bacterium]
MAGQTYSPYRRSGRSLTNSAGAGRAQAFRRSGLSQSLLAQETPPPAPARKARPLAPAVARGLADPAARRWVVLGALGIFSSLLLTVAVALLSTRGVASADVPPPTPAARSRVTLVREIGGVPRSPTPGTGVTASAPAVPGAVASSAEPAADQGIASTALRQLRRVGRAIVTADGVRHLALGGAVPFADGNSVTAFLFSDDSSEVALGQDEPVGALLKTAGNGLAEVVALASPAAVTPTSIISVRPVSTDSTPTAAPATATLVPATATPAPATATPVPATATPIPATATSVPPTAVPATATPVVVTATPEPATQTPIIVTATPEPTRRPTRTPTPEEGQVIIVTATPWTSIIPNIAAPVPPVNIPWLSQPTNTPLPTATPFIPPTAAPTNTPIPTATQYTVHDPRSAPAAAAPPRREAAPAADATAPILAEAGTRTPATPVPPRGTPQPGQPANGQPANGQQPAQNAAAPSHDPSVMEKLAARALIAVNAARAQAGALPLARNAALDVSSGLHAQYDLATGQVEGNFQTRGTPHFVGETPAARAARAAAGSRSPAVGRVAEVMALGETEPERVVQGWLDSVFHRALILDLAAQYAGYGQSTSANSTTAVLDLGGRRDVANASGWFPAAGATEVPTQCACDDYAETVGKPGPFGYPATLLLGQQRPQGMPSIATLSEGSEDGPGVPAELVDAYGNPTLLPQAPLKPGTKYVVRMAWTNGPNVSWSFTTGN